MFYGALNKPDYDYDYDYDCRDFRASVVWYMASAERGLPHGLTA